MPRDQLAHGPDALHGGLLRRARGEQRFHAMTDFAPFLLRDLGSKAAVRNDFDVVIGPQHIDQDTVVQFSVPDAEMRERFDGPRPRR